MMVFVLILLLGCAAAQHPDDGRRTLCGKELANVYFVYCHGYDSAPEHIDLKMSPSAASWVLLLECVLCCVTYSTFPLDSSVTGSPQIPERFSYSLKQRRAAQHDRFTSGLVQSCCLQPCSMVELLNYC